MVEPSVWLRCPFHFSTKTLLLLFTAGSNLKKLRWQPFGLGAKHLRWRLLHAHAEQVFESARSSFLSNRRASMAGLWLERNIAMF